jgi:hypothetical protein
VSWDGPRHKVKYRIVGVSCDGSAVFYPERKVWWGWKRLTPNGMGFEKAEQVIRVQTRIDRQEKPEKRVFREYDATGKYLKP